MLDAIVGAVIMVFATSSLLYSIELAERAFDKAGQYPLSEYEKRILKSALIDEDEHDSFWRLNILKLPREVGNE